MAYREFTNQITETEAPSFSLEGRKFSCLARAPAGIVRDINRTLGTSNFLRVEAMSDFVRGCLTIEDEPLWDELIYSKTTLIDARTIGDIYEYLIGEYFPSRPTPRPSGSPDGPSPTEAT